MGLSIKERVARRVREVQALSPVTLSGAQLADIIAPEFDGEATRRTIVDYCRPGSVSEQLNTEPRDYELVVGSSDWHVPFHNEEAVRNFLRYCEDVQPDHIPLNGDILDCVKLGFFKIGPGMPDTQDEIDVAAGLLEGLRRRCPNSRIYFLEGNHEERLQRQKSEHRGFGSLRALEWRKMLELDRLRISFHEYMAPVQIGDLTVVHGKRTNMSAAKSTLLDLDCQNVWIGHTHKLSRGSMNGLRGMRRYAEMGGLFDRHQAHYIPGARPSWSNGFIVSRQTDEWSRWELVEVSQDGSFCVGGRVYR